MTESLKQKISSLRQKNANLTPEDYRGERKVPEDIQKKLDFIRKVRKDTKNQKSKFEIK